MDDNFELLVPWLQARLGKITPARRIAVMRAIGKVLRRNNAQRIRANVEPEGGAMPARLPKKKGKLRAKAGLMFKRIGLLRNIRVKPTPGSVTIDFQPRVAQVARVHHFGLADVVDRRQRQSPRVRYAQRRLLGLSAEDRGAVLDEALKMLDD